MVRDSERAAEALGINSYLKYYISERNRDRRPKGKPKTVYVKYENRKELKTCRRACSRCPIRFRCYTNKKITITEKEWIEIDITRGTGKTLREWKNKILEEMQYVDVKPFSHNIITLALQAIDRGWGTARTKTIIKNFGLKNLGW
jgi:hypothetical protein